MSADGDAVRVFCARCDRDLSERSECACVVPMTHAQAGRIRGPILDGEGNTVAVLDAGAAWAFLHSLAVDGEDMMPVEGDTVGGYWP